MAAIRRVLVTGVSGYIGGSVAVALQAAGYQVCGVVRREKDALAVRAAGMVAVPGELTAESNPALDSAIQGCDAVIHAAECDSPDIAARLLKRLRGSGKTFIYTSGAGYLASPVVGGHSVGDFVYTEDFPCDESPFFPERLSINRMVLRAARENVRSVVLVPAMVYGEGKLINRESKQLPMLTHMAQERGYAEYLGEGAHRWSHVHIDDMVALFLLALEHAKPGSLFYAENGQVAFRELAQAIQRGSRLEGEPRSLTFETAVATWGNLMASVAFGSNCRINADKARLFLGWNPQYTDITEYIQKG
ncbi:NAD-dependent epimerase/dehydratase family protein [Mangrovibacter yixingensis]|uniref:NAD-dependent epimerase/dehydratase family protein n=1 Tax=Mangrovibacter yixingensis TaxID=1529639 RepID=UPI001CFCA370|nr:NAD-dependent epimerase/dehydratase family protein [Mangrovibacter yixingensis]